MNSFRGRNSQLASKIQASAPSLASVGQIPINYGGVASASVAPSVPKITQVLPKGAIPSNAFSSGAVYQVELEYPKTIGKLTDSLLQMTCRFSTADTDGADIVTVPSFFMVSRIEVLADGQPLETVEASELWQEDLAWTTDVEFNLKRSLYNVSGTGGFTNALVLADETATVDKTFYLPLNACLLGVIQPFIKGFNNTWSLRLTMATNIVKTSFKTGTSTPNVSAVELTGLKMFCTEQNLGDAGEQAQMNAHQSGAVYKTIVRNKFVSPQYASIPNTADFSQTLTSFNNSDSAAVLIYVRKGTEAIADILTHNELNTLSLRDSGNSEITITLPAKIVEANASRQVPINSAIVNNSPSNNYLMPFCSHLGTSLESGKFLGGLHLTGAESVVIKPVSNLTDCKIVVVSYDYAMLKVMGGKVSLERHA